jgi:beta-lactamase regulating signal transducer with metallopeptidase domain
LLVSAAVGLFRLRDVRTETAVWTLVLAAAIAMPVLASVLPQLFPHALRLPVMAAGRTLALQTASPAVAVPVLPMVLALIYGAGVLVFLARLVAGLVLLIRLYTQAEPSPEPWARGKAVRFSAAVDGPLSFAHCILLPADYRLWPETHRIAVLAHEECHIRRGDFFIQLLASVHRALFWFSPFAWWLQNKLGALAETASDAAGAGRVGDAASYAEILIDVTREARRQPASAAMAMAHGPGLAKRVDQLLAKPSGRAVGGIGRAAALAAVAVTSLGLAEVHAAAQNVSAQDPPTQSPRTAQSVLSPRDEGRKPLTRAARPGGTARASSSTARRRTASAAPTAPSATAVPAADEVSYDPLALLDDSAAVLPTMMLAGRRNAAPDAPAAN